MLNNETDIIQRAKFLRYNSCNTLPMKKCVSQALNELGDKKELCSIYSLFDITKNDIENYLLDKYFIKEIV